MPRYRIRFAALAEMVAEVSEVDEEAAYDLAVGLIKERLEQVAVGSGYGRVAIHADIDGLEGEEVVEL